MGEMAVPVILVDSCNALLLPVRKAPRDLGLKQSGHGKRASGRLWKHSVSGVAGVPYQSCRMQRTDTL